MSRVIRWLFHAACVVVFMAAISLDWNRTKAVELGVHPRGKLLDVMKSAGYSLSRQRTLTGGELFMTFSNVGCATPINALYLPASHPESAEAHALAEATIGRHVVIHDGEIVDGVGTLRFIWRLTWRKLLVDFRLMPPTPWASIVVELFIPSGCDTPKVDWSQLAATPQVGRRASF